MALAINLCAPGHAAEVATVKSRELKPYSDALTGFKSTVDAHIKTAVILTDDDPDGKAAIGQMNLQKVDLVFVLGSDALRAVRNSVSDVPILFSFVLDPETIIGSPEQQYQLKIRGITMNVPPEEQLRMLTQIAPGHKRIGIIYDAAKSAQLAERTRVAAARLGLSVVEKTIAEKQQAIDAITEMSGKIDAFLMLPDTTFISKESFQYLLLFSFRNNVPIIGLSDKYARLGALFALTFDSEKLGKQAGELATKMLAGTDTEKSLYVDPQHFQFTINIKTARKLGITIPGDVLNRADEVYE
ncbi:MAG: hypothetical protein A2V90_00515 [Gammaproteobacteria bacterium RBG_16_57_12]|nr:MAG: hypothetical protein A2V90_00515 [Gammaproteobacteria bacterium RBG_16_57_12]